jgi:hypothetical protein
VKAWKRLHKEKKDVIIKAFQQVGLSLNPNGSKDSEIKIKDLEGIQVGNWELEVDVTQEEDEHSATLEAVLEAEKAPRLPPALEDNLSDSDRPDINITKASLRPGRRYFTAEEAEAGEPLIIDEEDITDSYISSEDGDDDSDDSFDVDRDDDDVEDHIMD